MKIDELTQEVLDYADNHCVGEQPFATPVAGLSVMRSRVETRLTPMIYQPVFCLVLQGAKETVIGGRTLKFARMQSLIVSVDLPAASRIVQASAARPYVALALELDMTIVRDLVEEIGAGSGRVKAHAAATFAADELILDAMRRLFALVERQAAAPVLCPLIVREIHYWLLTTAHGAVLEELAHADSHAARIARAIALIRRDFADPLPVAALASVAAMSLSAFHEHFRAVTGTSPLQFQKQLKLAEARRLMLSRRYSVADAAFEVGYESPTQFSREYSRHFGASPRQDLRISAGIASRALGRPAWRLTRRRTERAAVRTTRPSPGRRT